MSESFSKSGNVEDFFNSFVQSYEELKNVEAKQRNFSVDISGEADNLCVIIDREGIFLNMSYFLPEGYKFAAGEKFLCNKVHKKVFLPLEETKLRGFFLSLLHEIGHAHRPLMLEPEMNLRETISAFSHQFYNFLKTIIWAPEWKRKLLDKDASYLRPHWLNKKRNDLKIKEERDSWQYAYDSCHYLEERGYNVLDGFENNEQIQVFMKSALATHMISAELNEAISKRF